MLKLSTIYHIHDICDRTNLSVDALLRKAKKWGYKKLAFVEHYPWPNNHQFGDRLVSLEQFCEFRYKVLSRAPIYGIEPIFGCEVEYCDLNRNHFLSAKNNLLYDYLILGQHFFTYPIFFKDKNIDFDVLFNKINQATDSLYDYQNHLDKQALLDLLKQYKEALATKSYTMVAHPDYWIDHYQADDTFRRNYIRDLINVFKLAQIPIGFNVARFCLPHWNPFRCPSGYFWKEVAKTNISVVLEADAHCIQQLDPKCFDLANEFIEALGLKNNLVSDIQINKLKHTIEIKKASDRDLTLISEFEKTIFDISLTYDLKQLKSMHANKNYQIFAAYSNLELVGYVIVSLSDNIDILKIFVVKHYRHCGIGKELINYVKRFKKPIILEVHQNNLTAISFYEALGFKQINIRKNYYGRHNAIVYFLNPVKNSKK